MIKPLELTNTQWDHIAKKLVEKHGPSIMISSVMRRKLGFVRRTKKYYIDGVYIAFWEEKHKTMFILQWDIDK